jgi:hypothetical protein
MMNCNDINEVLDIAAIGGTSNPEIREHLETCARCRKLVAALGQPKSEGLTSTNRLQQIEGRLLSDLRPVHRTRKEGLLAALALIFLCAVAFGVTRMGAFALAVMTPLQAAVMLAAVCGGAALTAYSLVSQIMPGSLHRIRPHILPIAVILSLALATVVLFQFEHERNFWPASLWCIRAGTKFGALAAVPLWLVARRGAVLSPITTSLAGGLFAGLVGTAVLEIHCPILDAWHILFAHLGVPILFTALAIAAGLVLDHSAAVVEKAKIIWQRP